MLVDTLLYLLLGAFAGLLAGLLGVGGGLVIVPILAAIFIYNGMPYEVIMHLALGTSLASILFTSISSVYSHHKHQAVSWSNVYKLSPGVLLGAWLGAVFASMLSTDILKPVFAIFELLVAAYLLWGVNAKAHKSTPTLLNFTISGGIIGYISSIVGIGGGTMTVPWLMWHGSSIHKAIATSAAIGFPIAAAGAASYFYAGWGHDLLPQYSLGFIYLPALISIIISSVVFAPLGAKLAHRLDVKKLKQIFAFLLISLATYLLLS